jgi:hypothetical protein
MIAENKSAQKNIPKEYTSSGDIVLPSLQSRWNLYYNGCKKIMQAE